jgi:hypothetical protein
MMYAMHVRRYDEPAEHAVETFGNTDIAVVEHRGGVEQDFEDQHGHRRRSKCYDHGELDYPSSIQIQVHPKDGANWPIRRPGAFGTTRSRVSQFMNKFRKLGFIDYNGKLEVHNSLLDVVLHDSPQVRRDADSNEKIRKSVQF